MNSSPYFFYEFINKNTKANNLIVQPRMGFSCQKAMKNGLNQVKSLGIPAIGTITIDSFTRIGNFEEAKEALRKNKDLNGYPIVAYSTDENKNLIEDIIGPNFPVQVRHGSPLPIEIFKSSIAAKIDAIEGGPISYCLPYSRVPLKESIKAWQTCCQLYAEAGNGFYHIESFGGCMMGQLCPPSMLIAITILEALFFRYYGIQSLSVSLAQGTNSKQDLAALNSLGLLCQKYLGDDTDWHIVYYTFMGKFPSTYHGAKAIIEESVLIAKQGKARRLILKTVKEAHQIPTIEENKEALMWANNLANESNIKDNLISEDKSLKEQINLEADFLINLVLNLNKNPGKAIALAFKRGYLDIPYCLHPSNRRLTKAQLDIFGNISWSDSGKIPFPTYLKANQLKCNRLTSKGLLRMLSHNQYKYDFKKIA